VNEKPIPFSAEMVRAILDGRKTQTRRVIKPQPQHGFLGNWSYFKSTRSLFATETWMSEADMRRWLPRKHGPYGQSGDHLWVRETWATIPLYDCMKPSQLVPKGTDLFWRADDSQTRYNKTSPGKWRSPIFMPRWASRITLRVTGVRVERVQEITEDDAKAEGAAMGYDGDYSPHQGFNHRGGFMALWDSINAKRGLSWDANPWVWVVEFERAEGGNLNE